MRVCRAHWWVVGFSCLQKQSNVALQCLSFIHYCIVLLFSVFRAFFPALKQPYKTLTWTWTIRTCLPNFLSLSLIHFVIHIQNCWNVCRHLNISFDYCMVVAGACVFFLLSCCFDVLVKRFAVAFACLRWEREWAKVKSFYIVTHFKLKESPFIYWSIKDDGVGCEQLWILFTRRVGMMEHPQLKNRSHPTHITFRNVFATSNTSWYKQTNQPQMNKRHNVMCIVLRMKTMHNKIYYMKWRTTLLFTALACAQSHTHTPPASKFLESQTQQQR